MSLLQDLNTSDDVTPDADVLGGPRGPLDAGLYNMRVSMAYMLKSKGGAAGVHLNLVDIDTGRELRQTVYISSGDAKGNRTYYEKDGQRHNLPGYALFRSLCLMTLNKEPTAITTEDKVVKVYSPEAGAEVATTVPVVTDLLDQEIIAGVLRVIDDKNVKNDAGAYVPSGETREFNELDKFFHYGTRMTVAEAKAGETQGTWIDGWEAKNAGDVRDKSTKTTAATAPAGGQSNTFAGAAAPAAGNATPKPASLFG